MAFIMCLTNEVTVGLIGKFYSDVWELGHLLNWYYIPKGHVKDYMS